jgi:hypothetical protein
LWITLACAGTWPSTAAAQLGYSGSQPWHNIFAKRYKNLSPEEERLQKFWHDYYDSLRRYYAELDRIDWVQYYKDHGYQGKEGLGGCRQCGGLPVLRPIPTIVGPAAPAAVPSFPPAAGKENEPRK